MHKHLEYGKKTLASIKTALKISTGERPPQNEIHTDNIHHVAQLRPNRSHELQHDIPRNIGLRTFHRISYTDTLQCTRP